MAYTVISQAAVCSITVNGSPMTHPLVSCEYEEGFDQATARGSFTIEYTVPAAGGITGIDFWYPVTFSMGATAATSVLRFSGFIGKFQYKPDLPSTTVTIPCWGHLKLAEMTRVPDDAGTTETPGIDMAGASGTTDSAMVRTVLDNCGLTSFYTASDIGGLPHTLGAGTGTNAKGVRTQYVWRRNQSGLDWIQQLEKVTLGYRTYDSLGVIVRRQITARPNNSAGAAVATFTEGVDIFGDAQAEHDVDEAFNRIVITGFEDGEGDKLRAIATAGSPKPNSGIAYLSWSDSSPLLELAEPLGGGNTSKGLSCREVADWRLIEKNQVRLQASYSTHRDTLLRAGDTISLLASQGMEIYQNVFVKSVRGVFDDNGWTQYLKVISPAAVGRGGAALPQEISYFGFIGLGAN